MGQLLGMPDTDGTVPDMSDHQNEFEFEQLREGQHVGALDLTQLSRADARFILRGATLARLTDFLSVNPLAAIRIGPLESGRLAGRYQPQTRVLELNTRRAGSTFGSQARPGQVAAVSAWGQTKRAAMQMSFVHELGHHLLETHPSAFGLSLAARQPEVKPISYRARVERQEYFCESLVAYTFFANELTRHDPIGHTMIETLHAALRREAHDRNQSQP